MPIPEIEKVLEILNRYYSRYRTDDLALAIDKMKIVSAKFESLHLISKGARRRDDEEMLRLLQKRIRSNPGDAQAVADIVKIKKRLSL